MDYSSCSEQFTEGQKQRMITALTTLRPTLLESRATETPPPLPADASCFPRVEDPNNSFGIGPVRVVLNTLDASSETFSTEGAYLDRVCDYRTTVQAGQTYNLEVYTITNDQKIRVYFDYNNNGDFSDDGELVFSSDKTGAPQIHTDSISIPDNPPRVNQVIRMRVVSDLITGNEGPCGTLLYGQTEDYGLTIQGSAPGLPIIQDFTLSDLGVARATMGAQIISNGGGEISEYGIVWSTEANPDITDSQDQKVTIGSDDFLGAFSQEVTNLPEDVLIFARGFATNGIGTAYTSDSSFMLTSAFIAETSILEFSGRVQEERVLLNWRAIEFDNDSFIIESSPDGTNWTDLKEVTGAGTSDGVVEYNETDEPSSTGRIFYRIRFLDSSGNPKYSEVIEVNFDPTAIISVYPLPADDGQITVFIPSFTSNDVRLIITDPIGRGVIERNYRGQQGQTVEEVFDVSFLQDGMYFLSIRDGDLVVMRRLIIYAGGN
ncbi:MAG: GEVED domain-containing protein, partial [Bacteroidota bacterium]